MSITNPVGTQLQHNQSVKLALGIAKEAIKLNSQPHVQNGETQRTSCSKKALYPFEPSLQDQVGTRTVKGKATADLRPRNGIGFRRPALSGTQPSRPESQTKTRHLQNPTLETEEEQGSVNSPRLHAPWESGGGGNSGFSSAFTSLSSNE